MLDFVKSFFCIYLFLKYFIYLFIFRERGKEGEKEGEKHQCVVASWAAPTGDLAHNPGMCPDWESNQLPFGSHASAPSTKPHQPAVCICLYHYIIYILHYVYVGYHVNWFVGIEPTLYPRNKFHLIMMILAS